MKVAQLGTKSLLFTPTAGATTARTASLDCAGATYATIDVLLGVETNTNATGVILSLAEGDDTNNYTTFNAAANRTVDNTAATIATTHIDLEGRKRYLKITATPDTVASNGAVTVAMVATLYKDVISAATTMLGPDVAVV